MLPEYQKILYSTDLSENARPAFQHAVSFAKAYGAKIYLVHVVPTMGPRERELILATSGFGAKPGASANLDEAELQRVTEEVVKKIQGRLERFAQEELSGDNRSLDWLGGIEVISGASPSEEILKAAERLDADLLVFGSHSKGMFKQTFLGSVAERVLENTCRPFLVVPLVD